METRIEYDSMGPVEVDARRIYGPQTQRSFNNFKIGDHRIPIEQIKALALVKKACALTNAKCGAVTEEKAKLIAQVVDEIVDGKWDDEFPLTVFQTGSGTQTNMNVNEVIAHRAKQLDESNPLHPNDDVNRGQSTNDTFPTAMHICAYFEITKRVIPALDGLIQSFEKLQKKGKGLQKVGRTHLQDATFIMVDQEISAFVDGLKTAKTMLLQNADYLLDVALGGTAVGTGVNTPKGYLDVMETVLPEVTGAPFRVKNNKFQGLSLKDAFMMAHGALNTLATTLFKIANDVRFLGSGPRCGYGEWHLPENEPGSSIMPGKVNPTQCEALVESCRLLADAMNSFTTHCIDGVEFVPEKLKFFVEQSLMIATSLTPYIGYDKSAKVVKEAYKRGCSIKEIILEEKLMTEDEFAEAVRMK